MTNHRNAIFIEWPVMHYVFLALQCYSNSAIMQVECNVTAILQFIFDVTNDIIRFSVFGIL